MAKPGITALSQLITLAGPFLVLWAGVSTGLTATFQEQLHASRADFQRRMEEIAHDLNDADSIEFGAEIERLCPKDQPDRITLFLPESATARTAGADPGNSWRAAMRKVRRAHAERLFALCERMLADGESYAAFSTLWEVLNADPEHPLARRMLGFVKYQGRWLRPYAARKDRAGQIWDSRFGWLLKKSLPRYESGERLVQGRWVPAAEEKRFRSDIRNGWNVETEHYAVLTNHSLEEGVRLASRLEALHDVWQQVFIGYLFDKAALAEMLRSSGGFRPHERRHDVVYFASRDEYNRTLKPSQPLIEITLGIYFDHSRTAFFFAGDEQDEGTLFHEGAHQLFQENAPANVAAARRANFWIVEGIACYMESLELADATATLGGFDAGRLPASRQRLLDDGFYVPLEQLTALGMADLQIHPDISKLYSQSSGLATFLMHFDDGLYRDALSAYLRDVYSGRDDQGTLSRRAGVSYPDLDFQYRQFLQGVLDPSKPDEVLGTITK